MTCFDVFFLRKRFSAKLDFLFDLFTFFLFNFKLFIFLPESILLLWTIVLCLFKALLDRQTWVHFIHENSFKIGIGSILFLKRLYECFTLSKGMYPGNTPLVLIFCVTIHFLSLKTRVTYLREIFYDYTDQILQDCLGHVLPLWATILYYVFNDVHNLKVRKPYDQQ